MQAAFVIRRKAKRLTVEYWTGETWSTIEEFAKRYNYEEGIGVIRQRFYRHEQIPELIAPKDV